MKRIMFLMLTILVFGAILFAQTKEISRTEFYNAYSQSRQKTFDIPQRVVKSEKFFRDGKLSENTDSIFEFNERGKTRSVFERTVDGKLEKYEIIRIGNEKFCKKNETEWKKSDSECSFGGIMGTSDIVSSKYFVSEVMLEKQKVKLLSQYTLFNKSLKVGENTKTLSFVSTKLWIDENGFCLRDETESGIVETKQLDWKFDSVFEFNPKDIKPIEPPIK